MRYLDAIKALSEVRDGDGLLEWFDEYQFVLLRALNIAHHVEQEEQCNKQS